MSRNEAFREGSDTRPTAHIFDMDGTLADISSIRHYVEGPKTDFHRFHEESVNVPPHDHVVDMARKAQEEGHKVLIVTARSTKYRPHTAYWLADHQVPSDAMYMRRQGDQRPDYEVKKDILSRISSQFRVVHAVDDNPNVLKLWHENGIPTTRVPGWPE